MTTGESVDMMIKTTTVTMIIISSDSKNDIADNMMLMAIIIKTMMIILILGSGNAERIYDNADDEEIAVIREGHWVELRQ